MLPKVGKLFVYPLPQKKQLPKKPGLNVSCDILSNNDQLKFLQQADPDNFRPPNLLFIHVLLKSFVDSTAWKYCVALSAYTACHESI